MMKMIISRCDCPEMPIFLCGLYIVELTNKYKAITYRYMRFQIAKGAIRGKHCDRWNPMGG